MEVSKNILPTTMEQDSRCSPIELDTDGDSGFEITDGRSETQSQSDSSEIKNSPDSSEQRSWSKFIVFVVGPDREKIYGEKSKMIEKSQAFYEIVYSKEEIEHPECHVPSFQIFIKYINTDELCFAQSHVNELFRLAFLYEVPHITRKCLEFAMNTLSLDNCVRYQLAGTLYELDELQNHAFKYMLRNGQVFLSHPAFVELDPLTLGMLIGRDDFHVSETDLFRSLIAWVEAECKRLNFPPERKEFFRRVSGNIFQHVRYANMTPKEFKNIVMPTGILNAKEIDSVLLRHGTHPTLWSKLPRSPFIDRQRLSRQQIRVPLYSQVQMGYRRLTTPNVQESFRFLASHDVFLVGIEFFGPARNGPLTSYKIKYQIENEFMNYYWKTQPESLSILTASDFEVELPHPYKIQSQFPYKLTVWFENFQGQISQYGASPFPQAMVILDNNYISILLSDNKTDSEGQYFNFRTQQLESPGIIKSLLFESAVPRRF